MAVVRGGLTILVIYKLFMLLYPSLIFEQLGDDFRRCIDPVGQAVVTAHSENMKDYHLEVLAKLVGMNAKATSGATW